MDKISVDREGSDKMTPLHYAARSRINDTICPFINTPNLIQIWKECDGAQCAGHQQPPIQRQQWGPGGGDPCQSQVILFSDWSMP